MGEIVAPLKLIEQKVNAHHSSEIPIIRTTKRFISYFYFGMILVWLEWVMNVRLGDMVLWVIMRQLTLMGWDRKKEFTRRSSGCGSRFRHLRGSRAFHWIVVSPVSGVVLVSVSAPTHVGAVKHSGAPFTRRGLPVADRPSVILTATSIRWPNDAITINLLQHTIIHIPRY